MRLPREVIMIKPRLRHLSATIVIALGGAIGISTNADAAPAHVIPASSSASPYVAPPSTSPSVTRGSVRTCPSAYACAQVSWSGHEYQFNFLSYGSYYLSSWFGSGHITDSQTGGATVRTINQSGGLIHCYSNDNLWHPVNWNSVWRIDLSASRCP